MTNAAGQRPNAVESTSNYTRQIDYDASNNPIYLGKANIGTLTSEAKWQIKKITYDANNNPTKIEWAGGNESFTKIWDNRTSLSYS